MNIIGLCFLVSGFCSLLYQTVWLQYCASYFGIHTPVISSFLSIFMLGLALGSFGGGWIKQIFEKFHIRGLSIYGALEVVIGLGGILVPLLLCFGRERILNISMSDSGAYFMATFLVLLISLLPFCVAMGATFPVAIACLREEKSLGNQSEFSRLYLWNLRGALLGVVLTVFCFIEWMGFQRTLELGVCLNFLIAALAFRWGTILLRARLTKPIPAGPGPTKSKPHFGFEHLALLLLGMSSMGLEIIWTRIYTPILDTLVYSFACILVCYFVASAVGTSRYREVYRGRQLHWAWVLLAPLAILCLASGNGTNGLWVVIGVMPASFLFGVLTPSLIDRLSQFHPEEVGTAYAANLLGCILGPLLTGFLLIPVWGNGGACLAWISVLLCLSLVYFLRAGQNQSKSIYFLWLGRLAASCFICLFMAFCSKPYEASFPKAHVYHDSTATVIATGEGMRKRLLVNGVGMTHLTTITKVMAHLPLVHLKGKPRKGLVICLGMGTSFRSMASWNIPTTAVELVPSVAKTFPYFFSDAGRVLSQDKGTGIMVDDGRRYLDRTHETYDVMVIDPPPPVEASSSGLLYSKEFYGSIKKRLAPDGILQAWLPWGDPTTWYGVTQALAESFPHIRMFPSSEGWGMHYMASMAPIPSRSADELVQQMSDASVRDIVEWLPPSSENDRTRTAALFKDLLSREIDLQDALKKVWAPNRRALSDDQPLNEYFLWRRLISGEKVTGRL